ncbi:unnamed protein product [Candidula unifasciata]|uniref:Motile sperm domain-containing protein 1 n=1 Tax=Candidula unifasciata TaxID=100452 RepID=A0A8S3Z6K6_9EUPU|nr:unnamed protein product [Candidula unifasciata]
MPTSPGPAPFVHPSEIVFQVGECPKTETFCVLNPFPHDIIFKVDNPYPNICFLSLQQGLLRSSNKVYIELTCTSAASPFEGSLQVRFFKCSRTRHSQRPHVQQYIGFREIKLVVLSSGNEKERSATGFPECSAGSSSGSIPGSKSVGFSNSGKRFQIVSSLALVFLFLLSGFVCNQINETWFATNIGAVTPHTCAVVCYTLAFVLLVRILTLR